MKRVLEMFGEPFANGGQEQFIMNMFHYFDCQKIQYTFFTPFEWVNNDYLCEIEKKGGKVYYRNGNFNSKLRKYYYTKYVDEFLRNHKFDIIHIHSGSTYELAVGAKLAKKYNIDTVIVHSHSTGIDNVKYRIIRKLSYHDFMNCVDIFCACSRDAAVKKFPKDALKNKGVYIINNGIIVDDFTYCEETRNEYRKKLAVNDGEFIVCNVGRLSYEKNQSYAIDIIAELLRKNINAKLLIVGDGEKKQYLEKYADSLHIKDHVIFLGIRHDVNKILQAADCFVIPSLFEGLSIAAIEAQAAGLMTYCSEGVPDTARLTTFYQKIPLHEGPGKWADTIINNMNYKRCDTSKEIRGKGFDAATSAARLEKIYLHS